MPVGFGFWSLSAQVRRIADLSAEDTTVERVRDAIADQGWAGFADLTGLARAVAVLALASLLGALIAYHPRSRRTVDRIVEAEAQKAYVMYAAIGALTGMMVLKYGMVMGFVIFGIGGLIRFRTDLRSASMTGRLILVTLVGLACGLNLPHLAVLATVFTFVLIGVLDANITYHITVKGLALSTVEAAAHAYRGLLERESCRVLGERKHFSKGNVSLVFRAPYRMERDGLDHILATEIPADLRGAVDWETE
jgi:hypothetical protein